jgi:hypothetical protein
MEEQRAGASQASALVGAAPVYYLSLGDSLAVGV